MGRKTLTNHLFRMMKSNTNSRMRGTGSLEAESCPPGRVPSLPAAGPGRAIEANRAAGPHYSEVASSGRSGAKRQTTFPNIKCNKNSKTAKNHHQLCIGSINVRTAKDEMKLVQCITQSKYLGQDITFIQETHLIGHQVYDFEDPLLKGWHFVNSGFSSKSRAGVGVVLSPGSQIHDIDIILEGRILNVITTVKGIRLATICVYAPTEEYAATTKDVFYSHLRKAIKTIRNKHPNFKIIIGGDMNATIGKDSEGEWPCIGNNNDDLPTNDNGTRLLSMCQEHSLFPLNTCYQTKRIHRDTWYSPTGFSKRNDYIIGEWYIKRFSTNCRVYRKASLPYDSDHRLLAASFKFPSNMMKKKLFHPHAKTSSKPHLDIKTFRASDEIIERYSNNIETILTNPSSLNNPEVIEQYIVTALKDASSSTIPCKQKKDD